MADYNNFLTFAGQAYGTSGQLLRAINQLENSGRTTFDINNWDSNARKGTPSGGPMQFIKPTFDAFARQAKAANPAAWKGVPLDWKSPEAQALAASWAISTGKGSHWATYSRAKKMAGGMKPVAPSSVAAQPSMGLSNGTPAGGNKAAAISLIFGNDPIFNMAAAKADAVEMPTSPKLAPFKAQPLGGKLSGYKDLLGLGAKLGLRNDAGNSQTTGGRHSPGSLHYASKAVDWGNAKNSHSQLMALANYARRNPGQFREFFYNPAGFGIKNGKVVKGLTIPGHDDHAHGATY